MAERKPISKRIRFEVFKRDKFTCQYCGRMAPDVTLEVDHIKPVSKGGKNEIMNLVTSCLECNRGKSNIELSDDAVIKKQQAQLQELADRKEQLELMLEWRRSLNSFDDECLNAILDVIKTKANGTLNSNGKRIIKRLIKEYSFAEVMDSTEIAINSYYNDSKESLEDAINKIGGICYLRKTQKDNPQLYYVNYTIKALKNRGYYVDAETVKVFVLKNVLTQEDFEDFKLAIKTSHNWPDFWERARVFKSLRRILNDGKI